MIRVARAVRICCFCVLATTLLAACLSDDGDDDGSVETFVPDDSIVVPTPSPTATVAPTPTTTEWINALLEPGPTAAAPATIFFLNGPDIWMINEDQSASQVTTGRRVRLVATSPDGSRAAAVFLGASGGRETEEIRLIGANGEESPALYGPEIVADPAANPRVQAIAWAPDGSQFAIVRDDGDVWLGGPEREPEELLEADGADISRLVWAPSGRGLALLARGSDGTGVIEVVSLESGERMTIEPVSSFGDFGWLAGQARIIATENREGGPTPAAGSLFTLLPDGTDRELLLSAGEFGPVVEITHLTPSPDGSMIAFAANAPNPEGLLEFQALWVLELETGARRQFPVAPGMGVNDLWWVGNTLAWRATTAQPDDIYDGAEPFIIEVADFETNGSRLILTTD